MAKKNPFAKDSAHYACALALAHGRFLRIVGLGTAQSSSNAKKQIFSNLAGLAAENFLHTQKPTEAKPPS